MRARILHGDCLEVMPTLGAESIDAIVTDPPYGLKFMGKAWDHGVPGVPFWDAALRVAKPGTYLLAFGGTRTYHRLACAIEDAGWEIHDCLSWLYGSGFPKHASKLKPAWEPIILARKPAPKATPLNIDVCRLAPMSPDDPSRRGLGYGFTREGDETRSQFGPHVRYAYDDTKGRWPANVVLDEVAAEMLDEQSGETVSKPGLRGGVDAGFMTNRPRVGNVATHNDCGGASRFYYVAKASRKEREAGLSSLALHPGGSNAKGFTEDVAKGLDRNRPVANHHPTVKPIALMRWLVRLVTPEGGTVLDPFTGSGSTGCAAVLEGRSFIGIEKEAEYADIARARVAHRTPKAPEQPSLFE